MLSSFDVLVVSSDVVVRRRLAEILVSLGIDPVRLSTLRECHEILARKQVGLVFCDPQVADGKYQDLLAAYPADRSRPRVVVTSCTADWEEFNEAMRSGAFDVISVPCRHTDVEWMVIQAKRAERRTQSGGTGRIESGSAKSGERVGAR